MNLSRLTNDDLLLNLDRLVRTERKITNEILSHISEFEKRRLFIQLGRASTMDYLTNDAKYSESAAYRRLKGARLLATVPAISSSLESGSLNLSQIALVQKNIEADNRAGKNFSEARLQDVLSEIENKSYFESQKIVAKKFDRPVQAEDKLTPQQDDSVRFEVTFSQDEMQILERAKNHVSHVCHAGRWSEVILHLAKLEIRRREGKSSEQSASESVKPRVSPAPVRRSDTRTRERGAIPVNVRRAVLARAKCQCEYVDPKFGRRCGSLFKVQVDHIIPIARGGTNEIENLRALCATHNLSEARRWGFDTDRYTDKDADRRAPTSGPAQAQAASASPAI